MLSTTKPASGLLPSTPPPKLYSTCSTGRDACAVPLSAKTIEKTMIWLMVREDFIEFMSGISFKTVFRLGEEADRLIRAYLEYFLVSNLPARKVNAGLTSTLEQPKILADPSICTEAPVTSAAVTSVRRKRHPVDALRSGAMRTE